ncbi:1-deoxy-D-xylulose-5-phosphate synthase [Lachnospiraceae bacterium A10]|nr:1-deoxy-D-xylulose-5-phosphate synthase [Lachnospiraceae bacterium A10]
MVLDKIKKPNDIKKLTSEELAVLPEEIRHFLIDKLSVTGGHLASNLGCVELTMALHLICNLPEDKIIWDVGHQTYTHKILTGRMDGFDSLRMFGGMSGFPKREDSPCDAFNTGHSSTSIAVGLGMAWAREMQHQNHKVISVIGDGALTGGLAWEALNSVAALKKNFIIVLNDNNMSISENVGALSKQLSKMRTSVNYRELKDEIQTSLEKIPVYGDRIVAKIRNTKNGIKQLMVPGMIFEEMGIMYLGPVDGHDLDALVSVLQQATHYDGPVIVHVLTKKGKGFLPAERHPSRFHGTAPFDKEKGLPLKKSAPTYTDIFSTVMRKMGDRDDKVVAITAAMADGTGLKRFRNMFPDRFFDVGIAEEYAVTFAAGLAVSGMKPVFAVYSSFLQRAFDQMIHDVCIQKLHVVFAIDRAGLVGADGDTHQGIFDLSYLSLMPNMVVMAPKNKWELSDMMKFALKYDGPIAIRYPRGACYEGLEEYRAPIKLGKSEEIYTAEHSKILLYAVGSMVKIATSVRDILAEEGIEVTLTNARFVKPLDTEYLSKVKESYDLVVTMEENVLSGGFGQHVNDVLRKMDYAGEILNIAIPDRFVEHGAVDALLESMEMDAPSIARRIRNIRNR